ncbi:hypothetical protein BE21_26105 [Sorangium cellulosum]|uniref:Uncharacterized protein n=1 Tax=Sorangium cellulosum TaxID=56 RepID=A0A150TTJ6_SORCE|nr:hypothetical protein BE21_26105 [Sorangium cellulosum]
MHDMNQIRDIDTPNTVKSEEPFKLLIKFDTEEDGYSANLSVQPAGNFRITPTEVRLPKGAGNELLVEACIERLEPKPARCIVQARLGESRAWDSPEVT